MPKNFYPKRIDKEIEKSHRLQLKTIKNLYKSLDTKLIIKKGERFFPFLKNQFIIDRLSKIHIQNILKLTRSVGNVTCVNSLKDPAINTLGTAAISSTQKFQRIIRLQDSLREMNIKLVGMDVSRTIIEYISTKETRGEAAIIIVKYCKNLGIKLSPKKIEKAIEGGFIRYKRLRNKSQTELEEIEFYRRYVLPRFNIRSRVISDKNILEIAKIWREKSVIIKLNTKKLKKLLSKLKASGLIVVAVSDMLGPINHYSLNHLGLSALFDAHFCSSVFGIRKRHHPSLFDKVTECFGISPKQALFIGNDIKDDIKASHNAGWGRSVYVTFDDKNKKIKEADLVVKNLDEFYELYISDKIPFLPMITTTPYIGSYPAQRRDDKFTRLLYALRQEIKNFPDRNFREWIYKHYLACFVGKTTRMGNNIEIRYPQKIFIGDNCQFNDDITILNEGPVIIGDNVMIARGSFISTYYHDWRFGMLQDNKPSWQKGNTIIKPVSIEENVWIGPHCIIEAGVYIGHHSMVGGNSLVRAGAYPPYSFIAGMPAKVIKNIKSELDLITKALNL